MSEGRYAVPLDVGRVLVCDRPGPGNINCIAVDVVADEVTSVHIVASFGQRFIVIKPDGTTIEPPRFGFNTES